MKSLKWYTLAACIWIFIFPNNEANRLRKGRKYGFVKRNLRQTYDKLTTEKIDFSKVKVEPLFEDMVDFDTFSKSDFRVVKVKNCEEVPKSKKLLKFTLDDGSEKKELFYLVLRNITVQRA